MVSQTISHYRIIEKLGAGGMGEVWLAEDTRLDRKVALKILPAEFTTDADRVRRFMQEAKAASALNHPNIITVYDIGESEAGRFIVMELVAGRTLRSVIARDNSLETSLALGTQMAKALSAAHGAGITHRDIKPDNIMVRDDGYVKVLDFGLARLLPTASDEEAATIAQQTTPGIIMGTVAYMSPEQARGQSATPPSDIFALGIVLYELMTGQHPFRAETLVGYLHAITLETPPPPSRLRPGIPPALDELMLRMLKKDVSQRPSGGEVAQAIQEIERHGDTTKPRQFESETILLPTAGAEATTADEGFWVAVLPFKSRGADADIGALAEGLTEDIVTGLSRFSYLRVISRSSTLRYASSSSDVRAIGKEIGARYVMEGNLRHAGSMLRLAVQLVDATTGAHLWAQTYDRPYSAGQIFALQDDLVPRIVSTVADAYGILPHSMSQAVRSKATGQLTPYETLLRSFSYVERVTAEEHAEAKAALERAVQQAPGDSDCWAMLSILHTDEHIHGFSSRTGLLEQALKLARRAVDTNPLNHRAHQALAWALCYRKEFDACRHAAERTVALNPMDASAIAYVGQTIAYGGGWERGCELLNRAMQLNPHHPGWYLYAPFLNAYRQGDYRGALDIALKMNMPGVSLMYVALAAVHGQLGELDAARDALRELLALRPDFKAAARRELEKLWDSELVERLIGGLRKAGLETLADEGRTEPLSTRFASGEKRADEGFWIAVLPFKVVGSSTELEKLASGVTEEIITGLSRFSYLRVIARSSTRKYSGEAGEVRAAGKDLGARYVMEGSIRQGGSTIRLAVQLIDATTGAHLWAETFDRSFKPDQIFAMQDDLVPRIVSTCGDHFGVLARSISEAVRWKDSGQLSPYEALMRGFGYHHRLTPSEHAEARAVLERAVEQAPGNADCWAMLSWIYSHEFGHGFNTQPDSLDRALAAARRAVDLAPSNHLAYQTLAVALFFRKDKAGCLSAAERAMSLNPLDASNEAIFLITFTGDWERGCSLIARAMELNPHHPGWYQWVLALNEYRKANYRDAIDTAVKANVPDIFWTNMLIAAAYGQLGELDAAREAAQHLLAQKEDFVKWARGTLEKWFEPELLEHLVEGLRKAGLEVDAPLTNSGGLRADEGFWVAVLPFKYRGANDDLDALAEALSEDIVTGLSRFSYLRIIARSSTLRYGVESGDVRDLGKALGARYVMEGSLRQAGSVLRIAVQLVDTSTGVHLWAETYNRTFSPEAVFELQDELVPRIVSTVADWYGVLPHSMSEAVRLKPSDQLSPYEAVLRSFGYYERITPEEHAVVRPGLERAVEVAPGNADGWAMLSMIYGEEHRFGFNAQPDPLGRSLNAARQAVDAAHGNHVAWLAMAQALFFRKEFDAFRDAAERAIALNPMDGSTIEYMSHLIAFSGDWERGCELAERARQLNPNHPAWYWAVPFLDAYRKGDYRSARTFLLKGNQQGHFFLQALIAAVQGQLGERESADKALREALILKPDFPLTARDDLGKWYLPELVDHLMDGLRKAGLEIRDEQSVSQLPVMNVTDTFYTAAPARHTVGREPERHELREAFNSSTDGRGSLICVAGEPGIGKTTLVEDFLAELTAEDRCTIARGRCSERLAGTEAYLPLLDALDNLLQSNESIATTMKQVAPTWYTQLLPLSGESDESARLLADVKAASQERMKRELASFLQVITESRPLVLFFDDLHWADVSTIDVLSFLAGKFGAMRALIVTTYRPSDMLLSKHPFLQIKSDLQARGVCRELLLEFLNEPEIAEYLELEFPGHGFPAEFPKLIHTKTEGSPLFMADVVRYLRDRGVIALEESRQDACASGYAPRWMLAQALPGIERELPQSVRGMIERKIAQLSVEDHKLLTAASVQGYEFDSAVLSQVLNLGADEVEERLENLERVFAFVKIRSESEFPNHTPTLRYRFVHVLYQNALLTALRATRKATLSREVAKTLEGFYGERRASVENELAALYEAGREFAKAAEYFQLAAEHAREVFADQEAAALAIRGIEALKALPETSALIRQELALQVVLGLALRTTRGYSNVETGRAYARASELCRQLGDAPQIFPVLFGLWEFYQSTGQLETAIELVEQLLTSAGQDPALLLVAHNVSGDHLTWLGSFVAAREHLEKGIALYDSERYRANVSQFGYDSGVACLGFASIVLWHLGYPDQALKRADEACDLAAKISHPLNSAYAASFAAWFYSLIGSMQLAGEHADRAIAISGQFDIAMFLAWGRLMKGWSLVGQSKIDEGMSLATQGTSEWRGTGTLLATSWCLGILAEGNLKAGRTEESRELLSQALDHVSMTGEHFYEAELYRLRGELMLKLPAQDTRSDAEASFDHAIAVARGQQAKSLELRAALSLARLWDEDGKREEARAMLSEIYAWFTEGFETADLKSAKALLDELQ